MDPNWKIGVNYQGDILAPSGYSRATRAHMRGLINAGVEVHGIINQKDKTQLRDELCKEHPYWKEHMPDVLKPSTMQIIKIYHETPEFFTPDPTQYNIGYTVWETTRIPGYAVDGSERNNWVSQMNSMDEIWTSADFCARAFRASGVTVPIRVFPHPIDLDEYSPTNEAPKFMVGGVELSDKMVFLSVFQFTKRKNPADLILAWTAEFAHQDDVALVIKTYGSDFGGNPTISDYLSKARIASRIPNLTKNLHLILDMIHDVDMPELYRMSDVFVLPSYGEGFGMPYQEAMACGKPVIYTNATSMREFCVGYSIACDPEPVSGMANIPWYNASQDWYKVRVNSLRQEMRQAYNDWKSGKIKALGEVARKRVEELHSFTTVGNSMRARLETILTDIWAGRCRSELAAMWGSNKPS